jgi:hypothetical protein
MSINGVGSTASSVPAAAAEPAPAAQATTTALKTLYGSPGMAEGLANTLQRMQQLLQPAQSHVKASHPEIQ